MFSSLVAASCPSNSHYELSGSTCEGTCASLIGQFACSERRFEGCQCDPGFVFDANKCVPLENCGCVFNGRYLRVRLIFNYYYYFIFIIVIIITIAAVAILLFL